MHQLQYCMYVCTQYSQFKTGVELCVTFLLTKWFSQGVMLFLNEQVFLFLSLKLCLNLSVLVMNFPSALLLSDNHRISNKDFTVQCYSQITTMYPVLT